MDGWLYHVTPQQHSQLGGEHYEDDDIRTKPNTGTQCPTLTRQVTKNICPVVQTRLDVQAFGLWLRNHGLYQGRI